MQEEALAAIPAEKETLILSPTGSGKTLAYLLPIVQLLKADSKRQIQAVVVVPARELALQIGQVFQQMGSGFRATCSYGGHPFDVEHRSLTEAPPDVLIGTPGRIVDHIENKSIDLTKTPMLVLDEFDKSLEFGFSEEMKFIAESMPSLKKKVLLSATEAVEIPDYMNIVAPKRINHLTNETVKGLTLKEVVSVEKDKLGALKTLLCHLGKGKSIIFANFRESADRIASYLREEGISCVCFHGGMEQPDREKAICLFRNSSVNCLISTDLAARGLDIPEVDYIIHYHLPNTGDVFTHRNGRTARMNASGQAFVIMYINEMRPSYLPKMLKEKVVEGAPLPPEAEWATIYIGKGKRDKISKGDVVGFLFQKGGLQKDELGIVEVKERYAMAAVKSNKVQQMLKKVADEKIKGMKTKFELVKAV